MSLTERLIKYLSANEGAYASGQRLADEMGVTRAAVWKAVEALRAEGYAIDSVRAKGYRLTGAPDRLGELQISAVLRTRFIGANIIAYTETGSTNREAMRLAAEGAQDGTLVVAESQSAGRGRLGRTWASPAGLNIYASVILRPGFPPAHAPLVTLAASVALARAISSYTDVEARIKWPNDILTPDGRKLAGILTEMSSGPDRIHHVVVGFGVNVNSSSADLPPDVRKNAASIRSVSGAPASRAALLARVLEELERVYDMLTGGKREMVLEEWSGLADTIGRRVRVILHDGELTGRAAGIDPSGALVVERDGGGAVTITSGDVVHLR